MRKRAILDTALIWLVVMAGILTCAVAFGQTITVKPDSSRLLGYAGASAPGKWVVFASGFLEVKPEVIADGKAIVWQGPAGEYAVVYFGPESAEPVVQKVVLGGGAPDPFPPTPPVPPTPPGQRWAIVWEESSERTPAQASLYIALRKQFKSDRLMILDVSTLPPAWEAYRKLVPASQVLPALQVLAADKQVRVVPLPSSVGEVVKEVAK
jgi:hypothetical protein